MVALVDFSASVVELFAVPLASIEGDSILGAAPVVAVAQLCALTGGALGVGGARLTR